MISACMAISVRELRTAVREWACWSTVDQIAMLILLTHVHRKNFGIYGRLHLFQNIVMGLTKQLRY